MSKTFLCALFLSFLQTIVAEDDTLATIDGVQIRGYRTTTINKRPFSAFRAIPYAESPSGNLRFKPPVPKVWTKTNFDATKEGPECPQTNSTNGDIVRGEEDCLVLNVYTHNTSKPLRKVMVFIHGGGFVEGSGRDAGPRRLLDDDLVLVTINYRLGVLGYMSTEDEASPGNYGLLDQTEALKWVQRNIAAFGGDPNKVTLFGQSSGSVNVFDHYVSPLSTGLFQRAIAQSGNVLNSWSEQRNPKHWANLIANSVDCSCANTTKMVECLRRVPVEKLIQATTIATNGFVAFSPSKDGYFFSDLPSKLFRSGQIANPVPLMFGITKDETLGFVLINIKPTQLSNQLVATALGMSLNRDPLTIPIDVIKLVRERYFNSSLISNNTESLVAAISYLSSDCAFFVPHIEAAQVLINNGINPFLYSFDYISNSSILKLLGITLGPAHAEDLSFLFGSNNSTIVLPEAYNFTVLPDYSNTPNDENERKFLDIWTNFAETGIPTEDTANGKIEWKSAQSGEINVYHLNSNITHQVYQPKSDWRIDFWLRQIPALLLEKQCK